MGVQFNLLPDVKLEFDRQQHTKRLVFGVATLVSGIALSILIVSFLLVNVLQRKTLNDANNNITTYTKKLKDISELDKVLTIQNQLGTLPGLHQQKHITSRLFTYLDQITPIKVNFGKLALDTTAKTVEFSGTADSVESVNTFVDTLKFTKYQTGDDTKNTPLAFSNVILSKISRDESKTDYTITASYNPDLFDEKKTIVLVVPPIYTTRSVLNKPDLNNNPLFNGENTKPDNQQGNQ